MKRAALLTLALALLTACSDNRVGVGLNFGPGGMSVNPRVSGSLGPKRWGTARIGISG